MKFTVFGIAGLMLAATAGQVSGGVVLDFTTLPEGSVTTIGDATFSLAGVGEQGAASIDYSFGGGLWNSTDGASYPTNTILRVDFAAPVSNVTFEYSPQGIHSDGQVWTIYDAGLAVLASGAYTYAGLDFYDLTAYSGIARIEWNNGGNNWLSNLNVLSYDPGTGAVPEPASIAMWGLGAIGLMFARRTRRQLLLAA